jgi:hypothetical protein
MATLLKHKIEDVSTHHEAEGKKKAKNQLTYDWSKKTAAIRLAPASMAGSST